MKQDDEMRPFRSLFELPDSVLSVCVCRSSGRRWSYEGYHDDGFRVLRGPWWALVWQFGRKAETEADLLLDDAWVRA